MEFENPLTPADYSSSTWHRLEIFLSHRLDLARKRNDVFMYENARGMILGEIAALKTLLSLRPNAIQDQDIHDQLFQDVGSPLAGRPVSPQTATPVRRSV